MRETDRPEPFINLFADIQEVRNPDPADELDEDVVMVSVTLLWSGRFLRPLPEVAGELADLLLAGELRPESHDGTLVLSELRHALRSRLGGGGGNAG